MRKSYMRVAHEVIQKSDVVIQVLDARLIEQTVNPELRRQIELLQKRVITAITKCDLVSKEYLDAKVKELPNAVYVSSKKRFGFKKLRELIYKVAAKNKSKQIKVGVVGYPNTGKSSLINTLKGKTSAPVSSQSGMTKGEQKIRVSSRVMLLDTPGVIPIDENDSVLMALIASKNPDRLKDPDLVAMKILQMLFDQGYLSQIEQKYDITITTQDAYEVLEIIAIKRNRVIKGGEPDILTISRQLIHEWQKGTLVTFEQIGEYLEEESQYDDLEEEDD